MRKRVFPLAILESVREREREEAARLFAEKLGAQREAEDHANRAERASLDHAATTRDVVREELEHGSNGRRASELQALGVWQARRQDEQVSLEREKVTAATAARGSMATAEAAREVMLSRRSEENVLKKRRQEWEIVQAKEQESREEEDRDSSYRPPKG